MNFTERDFELINSVSKKKFKTNEEIKRLPKNDLLKLTEQIGGLIGYDPIKNDIDDLGIEADNIISKILKLLEKRGEM